VVGEKRFRLLPQKQVLKLPPTTTGNVALEKPSPPFSCVDNVAGLAQILGVPKDVLFCVEMMQDTLCGVSRCIYYYTEQQPAHHNGASGRGGHPRYVYHHQEWYQKSESDHGHKLLGWDFISLAACRFLAAVKVTCASLEGVGYVLSTWPVCQKTRLRM
jgi:hypothetical protein